MKSFTLLFLVLSLQTVHAQDVNPSDLYSKALEKNREWQMGQSEIQRKNEQNEKIKLLRASLEQVVEKAGWNPNLMIVQELIDLGNNSYQSYVAYEDISCHIKLRRSNLVRSKSISLVKCFDQISGRPLVMAFSDVGRDSKLIFSNWRL
ncbi:hypothetical protein GW916_07430 [bacterium]|nr:hypothetical protein [bacterium]